jgi:hypothetical protein
MFGENIFQIFSKLAIFFQIILGVYIYIFGYIISQNPIKLVILFPR